MGTRTIDPADYFFIPNAPTHPNLSGGCEVCFFQRLSVDVSHPHVQVRFHDACGANSGLPPHNLPFQSGGVVDLSLSSVRDALGPGGCVGIELTPHPEPGEAVDAYSFTLEYETAGLMCSITSCR
jgi:hypothetical protein